MRNIMTLTVLAFVFNINAQTIPSAGEMYNRIQVQPMQNTINSINILPAQAPNTTIDNTPSYSQPSYNNDFLRQHGIDLRSNSTLSSPGQWSPSLQREIIIRNGRNFNDNRVLQFQNNEIIITPY